MKREVMEVLLLEEQGEVSLSELAELSHLSETQLMELVEWGVLTPLESRAAAPIFDAQCIISARTARRLRADFDLDAHGVALALTLLERIRELEDELRELAARLPPGLR